MNKKDWEYKINKITLDEWKYILKHNPKDNWESKAVSALINHCEKLEAALVVAEAALNSIEECGK
jgi:hypothetical protein